MIEQELYEFIREQSERRNAIGVEEIQQKFSCSRNMVLSAMKCAEADGIAKVVVGRKGHQTRLLYLRIPDAIKPTLPAPTPVQPIVLKPEPKPEQPAKVEVYEYSTKLPSGVVVHLTLPDVLSAADVNHIVKYLQLHRGAL